MKRGAVFLIGLAMAVLPGGGDLAAQTATPPVSFADDFEAHADSMHALTRDRFELVGNVTFKAAGIVIQADRLVYDRATRSGEAHGNVLYAQAVGRLAGDRITFNIEERTAEIRSPEVRPVEIRLAEIRLAEVRSPEVCAVENRSDEFRSK